MMRKGLPLLILLLLSATQIGLGQEKVNINTANALQLQTLPGIGPVTAQAIVDARPYASINELTRARGIGPKTLEQLRPLITVGEGIEGALEPEAPAPKEPGKININTASSLELQTLPGIGPVTAPMKRLRSCGASRESGPRDTRP